MSRNNQPAWADDKMWPKPTDTVEELEAKRNLNLQAAVGEMILDTVLPDRDSDITEFQSNAATANEYIQQNKDK